MRHEARCSLPLAPKEITMANRFAHTELNTTDVDAAKAFYAKVFDWEMRDVPMGESTYTILFSRGKGVGGIQKKPIPEAPTAWLPYVEVVDVKESLAKALEAGGIVVVDHQDIGENGSIGVFLDSTGAALGVWAPTKKADRDAKKAKKRAEKDAKKAEKQARKDAKKAKKAARKKTERAEDGDKTRHAAAAPAASKDERRRGAEKKVAKRLGAKKVARKTGRRRAK
jgi:predicted enzyme related to lactoylglutathione lyase